MQIRTKRFGVVAGFGLMLVVLGINAWVLGRQFNQQLESQNLLSKTRQTILELATTESILKDAETSQRGYLYTRNPAYLGPYRSAIPQIQQHLEAVRQLTLSDPVERARAADLRNLVDNKLAELEQAVQLAQAGKDDQARALVDSNANLLLMTKIRNVIAAMQEVEHAREVQRMQVYQATVDNTRARMLLTRSFAAVVIVLLGYYTLREMDLRERHAQQLLEREAWFRVTLTSLGDAVIATDAEGKVSYLNPLAERLIGTTIDRARGRDVTEVFPIFNELTLSPVENPVARVIASGRIVGLANHTVLRNASGVLVPIEDSAAPIRDAEERLIGVVLVFRDATESRKTQAVLRETEKLSSAARLAATMAHEINNPLEAVTNLIYLARSTPEMPVAALESLDLADRELRRLSHITRQTLGFYRESRQPERIDLAAMIDSVLSLYASKIRAKSIAVERQFGPCPPVSGLDGELRQAISNLISNAADAVPQHGRIRIALECLEDGRPRQVRVRVEDNGPGIPPEHLNHIFEPFYTTKKDVGTGLGLWVTREIAERHQGSVRVIQQNGVPGATFELSLPVDRTSPLSAELPGQDHLPASV